MDLERLRAEAAARVASLSGQVAEVVAASQGSNADDEHDPEGATIAFERQQLRALLAQAHQSLAAADAALSRRADGCYGTCADCRRPMGAERLAALPSALLCIGCARRQPGRG